MGDLLTPLDLRTRTQFLMTYAALPAIELTIAEHAKQIMHYAFIKHDKDVKPDGSLIEPHFHVVLYLRTDFSLQTVINWFKEFDQSNTMAEILSSKTRAYEYLTHKNNPEKYQYEKDEVITDSSSFWYDKNARSYECVLSIARGADPFFLVREYGRDYVLNAAKYEAMADKFRACLDDKLLDQTVERSVDDGSENCEN